MPDRGKAMIGKTPGTDPITKESLTPGEPGPSQAVRWIEVAEDEAGQRIDNYLLARLKGVPKSLIYRILRSGEVRINSKRVEASRRVASGDRIRIPPVRVAERGAEVPAPHFRLPILFEDDALVAIDKPSGLAVHGGSGVAHGVIESLRSMRPQARFLELVHRLDRETSGVLLVAKKRASLLALHEMMRTRAMDKRYLVGVAGRFRNQLQRVSLALAKRVTREGDKRVSVTAGGQEAETVFRRIARGEEFSLLEAELLTGRTHQIRVHLAHLKHPVLGDDKYGNYELNKRLRKQGLKRMFLHAASLRFAHPVTGQEMRLEAPLPNDLAEFARQRISQPNTLEV
jgi:23S rRNA pseudouridine955/2504/2580 synthase